MAKTLLNGVNEVAIALKIIQGDSGTFTSLTDSARQTHIDLIRQKWGEAVDEVYRVANKPKPQSMAENTITLATSDRDYALQTDIVELMWPFQDETNGNYILEWKAGYLDLVARQPQPAQYTGLPYYGVIRPTDGELYLDSLPTATENGRIYKYRYRKDLTLDEATDTFPFTDTVFRAMVPVVAELFSRKRDGTSDDGMLRLSFARAARELSQNQVRTHW